jgi:hypothetical protein
MVAPAIARSHPTHNATRIGDPVHRVISPEKRYQEYAGASAVKVAGVGFF